MKLPEVSVKHPVTTIMVFLALLILGLVSLSQLGLELLPDITYHRRCLHPISGGGTGGDRIQSYRAH